MYKAMFIYTIKYILFIDGIIVSVFLGNDENWKVFKSLVAA
jgi:hypothetical protein